MKPSSTSSPNAIPHAVKGGLGHKRKEQQEMKYKKLIRELIDKIDDVNSLRRLYNLAQYLWMHYENPG